MLKPEDFFDLSSSRFAHLFDGVEYVWEALGRLKKYAREILSPNVGDICKDSCVVERTVVLYRGAVIRKGFAIDIKDATKGELKVTVGGEILEGASVIFAGAVLMDKDIEIGRGTVVEPGALIKGPSVIGDNTEVRQGAYVRGDVLVGDRCVVGHTTEMKSAVMLGGSKAGHFAYIGDSILGSVNLGAGTKLANLKITESEVTVKVDGKKYRTGLKKFGAILGDGVELGCNTVTAPGTLLPKKVLVYPNATVTGYHPAGTILKVRQTQENGNLR
jgi:NDP-sugar pyrophosphorylase family protein